jgi:ADP-heptose:LPS heptosyltransferase
MNILFVTSTRIGDAVMSTGLLSHFIARFPEGRITVACGPLPAPLFAAAPGVARVIELVKRPFAAHWLGLWAAVVGTAWDIVVDLRASGLAWTLWARKRHVLRRPDGDVHRVEALARLLGLTSPPSPRLWLSEAHRKSAVRLMGDGPAVLGVGPTANWRAKIWPADRFVDLIVRLTAPDGLFPGARVAVFGAPDERPLAEPVLQAIPPDRCVDLVGTVDLPTAAACLQRCAFYVGNDSGLMHMAAAAGTPTLGLFGPSPAVHYAPWGRHCAVAATEVSYADLVGAPDFDHRANETLMTSLSVEAVEREARALWRRLSGEAA